VILFGQTIGTYRNDGAKRGVLYSRASGQSGNACEREPAGPYGNAEVVCMPRCLRPGFRSCVAR